MTLLVYKLLEEGFQLFITFVRFLFTALIGHYHTMHSPPPPHPLTPITKVRS